MYGIVKQSDGFVWGYSEPGRGSTFKLYLPAVDRSAPSPSSAPPPAVLPGRGETVLVVEDDAGVRRMTRRVLEDAGYRVLEAANGQAAVDLLQRDAAPVLTDVVMPGMGGRELAQRLAEVRPDVPLLFVSGYTDGEIARRGLLDPGAAFVQKPYSPDVIARIVRERLDAASLPSAPPPAPRPPALDSREPA